MKSALNQPMDKLAWILASARALLFYIYKEQSEWQQKIFSVIYFSNLLLKPNQIVQLVQFLYWQVQQMILWI